MTTNKSHRSRIFMRIFCRMVEFPEMYHIHEKWHLSGTEIWRANGAAFSCQLPAGQFSAWFGQNRFSELASAVMKWQQVGDF